MLPQGRGFKFMTQEQAPNALAQDRIRMVRRHQFQGLPIIGSAISQLLKRLVTPAFDSTGDLHCTEMH